MPGQFGILSSFLACADPRHELGHSPGPSTTWVLSGGFVSKGARWLKRVTPLQTALSGGGGLKKKRYFFRGLGGLPKGACGRFQPKAGAKTHLRGRHGGFFGSSAPTRENSQPQIVWHPIPASCQRQDSSAKCTGQDPGQAIVGPRVGVKAGLGRSVGGPGLRWTPQHQSCHSAIADCLPMRHPRQLPAIATAIAPWLGTRSCSQSSTWAHWRASDPVLKRNAQGARMLLKKMHENCSASRTPFTSSMRQRLCK